MFATKKSLTTNKRDWLIRAGVFALFTFGLISEAFAGGGGNMPWEGPLNQVVDSLSGPVAFGVGSVAIAVTGLTFALGEGGPIFKKSMAVLFGLTCVAWAPSLMNKLGFVGGGLL